MSRARNLSRSDKIRILKVVIETCRYIHKLLLCIVIYLFYYKWSIYTTERFIVSQHGSILVNLFLQTLMTRVVPACPLVLYI